MSVSESPKMWDIHWNKSKLHVETHHVLLLACEQVLKNFNGKKTLEVGSGRSIDSIRMAQKGADAYTVDFSAGSISVTRILENDANVLLNKFRADATQLPFRENTFDLVFSQGLMEHPEDREQLLKEQIRVAKSGGYILVDIPNLYSIQTPAREAQIKMGRWPYGKEHPLSFWQLKALLKDFGLIPVRAYGWDILPLLYLGIRSRLRQENFQVVNNNSSNHPQELPLPNFFTKYIEMNVPWFLNNIGVIAQKEK